MWSLCLNLIHTMRTTSRGIDTAALLKLLPWCMGIRRILFLEQAMIPLGMYRYHEKMLKSPSNGTM